MLIKLRSKLTYPYVASTLALFLALTGGAFALQGKNSVDSGDIRKNAVKSSDIRSPNGVKTGDVTDNGLTGTDLDEATLGQVPSALNAENATNATNAQNAQNAQSAQSSQSSQNATTANQLGNVTVQRTDFTVANGTDDGVTVNCASGQQALAGGVRNDDADTDGYVEISRPVLGATEGPTDGETFGGWRVFVYNQTDAQSGQTFGVNTLQASAWVVCAG